MDKYYKIKGYEDYYITKSGKIFSSLTNKIDTDLFISLVHKHYKYMDYQI